MFRARESVGRRYHPPITTPITTPVTTPVPPPDPGLPGSEDPGSGGPGPGRSVEDSGRIGTLRGPTVRFDARRAARVALGVVLGALLVVAAVLAVAGFHSNEQIDRLRNDGVPVTVTVTKCLGLLGGSGSNAAGYSCEGTYVLGGVRYTEPLPGSTFSPPGAKLRAIAVPGDPALVSPVSILDRQHASATVYIVPAVLFVVALGIAGAAVFVGRRRSRRGRPSRAGAAGEAGTEAS
jgi:uncharacterized membrane protein YecN with MAPEG domain